jgi:hypothetical protein
MKHGPLGQFAEDTSMEASMCVVVEALGPSCYFSHASAGHLVTIRAVFWNGPISPTNVLCEE